MGVHASRQGVRQRSRPWAKRSGSAGSLVYREGKPFDPEESPLGTVRVCVGLLAERGVGVRQEKKV